ncbi:MAG: hypothetical protein KAJ67_05435, partial [Gemmatimonadetes bacterium]|nr:hypothetical protein [Gemmatimonadota bacterium]
MIPAGRILRVGARRLAFAVCCVLLGAPGAGGQETPAGQQGPAGQEVLPGEPPFDCAKCHSRPEFLAGKTDTPEGDAALLVPDSIILSSRHDTLACTSCHPDQASIYPHEAPEGAARAV